VRLIYVDEAGVSNAPHESIGVVGALLVHGDLDWPRAYNAYLKLLETVPEPYREGFEPHATEIWNDPKYREHWSHRMRIEFIKGLVAIPRQYRIPLALCSYDSSTPIKPFKNMSDAQAKHAEAFCYCLAEADGFIEWACDGELAVVIVEDVRDMRRVFKQAANLLRSKPIKTERFGERVANRIIDTPHFVTKGEAPLMAIVDACVFSIRRWLKGHDYGEELVSSLFEPGEDLVKRRPPEVTGWRTTILF
jgi:hypothetical protein